MRETFFTTIAQELVLALRGRHTQNDLSKLLHVSSVKISKWESGRAKIYWRDLTKITAACHVDLKVVLKEIIGFFGDRNNTKDLFRSLVGDDSPKEICAWLGCSRSSFSRWFDGAAPLPLVVVLSLLSRNGRLTNFLENLVELDSVPSIKYVLASTSKARSLFSIYPDSPLLMCALATSSYREMKKHKAGWLADFLGISRGLEEKMLRELVEHKLVGFDGKKYFPMAGYTNSAWGKKESFDQTKKIKLHLMKRGLAALQRDQFDYRTGMSGYDVYESSPQIREKISREVLIFFKKIHRILEDATDEPDGVSTFQYQIVDNLVTNAALRKARRG